MTEITEGDASDVAAIMPIMNEAFDPAFGESWTAAQCLGALMMPGTRLILARREGRLLGFAISKWVLDEEELLMLGVLPDAQRQGAGSRLFNEIIRNMIISGRKILFLEVRDGNNACSFYQSLGFTVAGRRKNYYLGSDGARYDAVTMILHV